MTPILTDCMSHSTSLAVFTWFKYFHPNAVEILVPLINANQSGELVQYQAARRKVQFWMNAYRMNVMQNGRNLKRPERTWTDDALVNEIDAHLYLTMVACNDEGWMSLNCNLVIKAFNTKPDCEMKRMNMLWDKITLLSALGDHSAMDYVYNSKHFGFDEAVVATVSSDVDLIELNTVLGLTDSAILERLTTVSAKMIFAQFVETKRGEIKVQPKPKGQESSVLRNQRRHGQNRRATA